MAPSKLTTLICVLILLGLIRGETYAQFHFKTLSTEDGLPQNSVVAMVQARDGYLWLATNDGLASFDGRKFTVFDASNSPGFCCNRLSAVYEDRDGALWIGTYVNKIIRYQNHQFTTFDIGPDVFSQVYSIKEDFAGNLMVNTSRGIYRGSAGNFSFEPRLGSYYFPDRSGAEYYVDEEVLIRYANSRRTQYRISSKPVAVRTIYQDRQGTIWIGAVQGLFRLSGERLEHIGSPQGLPEVAVRAICEDPNGYIWIGTLSGLFRYRDGRVTKFETNQPFPSNDIASLVANPEGLVWAGTSDHGLVRINKTIISTITQKDGLPADNIYPIFQDSQGKIWIGSWPAGITIYQNGKLEKFRVPGIEKFTHPIAFSEDKEGRIWIATLGGLWWYKDGKVTDYLSNMPPRGFAHAILPDSSGAIWFGTEQGLVRLFQEEITLYTKKDGLKDDHVISLLEDREGGIWIGAMNGLSRFFKGRFTTYNLNPDRQSDQIRALHEDEEGTIWVGTFDGGLARLGGGKITNYTRADGLFCKGVFTILDDERGNFWMSCNWGIYRVSKLQLKEFAEGKLQSIISIPYGQEDGLRITECNGGNQDSGLKSKDGKLWIPTMGGVAVIDLAKELPQPMTPPLIINRVMANETWLRPDGALAVTTANSNIEIHYDSLSFFKPEKIRFRYLMEGLDQQWINAGDQRVAIYPYLPPGAYKFKLSASFDGGAWYESGKQLSIAVPPPFWATWVFIIFVASKVVMAAYFLYRRNISKLIKQGEKQRAFSRKLIDSLELERRKIARELHDDVVNDLASLAISVFNLSNQAPQNGGNLKQRMIDVHNQAMDLTEHIRHLSHSLHPASLQHLGLLPAVQAACEEFRAKENVAVEIYLDDSLDSISLEADVCLYRIVQEGLRNVAKHAHANSVLVSLRRFNDKVELIISDDGIGFDHQQVGSNGGLGLISMQERLGSLGGELKIVSAVGHGAEITVVIPLLAQKQKLRRTSVTGD